MEFLQTLSVICLAVSLVLSLSDELSGTDSSKFKEASLWFSAAAFSLALIWLALAF